MDDRATRGWCDLTRRRAACGRLGGFAAAASGLFGSMAALVAFENLATAQ
jgi:hypothetical protein